MPTLDLACTKTHTFRERRSSRKHFLERFHYIHTGDLVEDDRHTYTHPCIRLIACTNTHTLSDAFHVHTYRSVSITRMQRYAQLAYLCHQCGTSLFTRRSFVDGTVRHPGVARSFCSYWLVFNLIPKFGNMNMDAKFYSVKRSIGLIFIRHPAYMVYVSLHNNWLDLSSIL